MFSDITIYRPAVLLSICLLLSGCLDPPQSPLRVGTNQWLGYQPLYLARQLGILDQEQIHLVELTSATEVMHALRSGALEAAALTLDEAISLLSNGVDLRIVAVLDFSSGADALVAHPDISSLSDLRGQRVGVENTAVGALMLEAALEQAGLNREDIHPVALTIDEHRHAFEAEEVRALVTFEPVKSQLLGLGAKVLFDSNRIAGSIVDVLVVRADVLEKRPVSVQLLLDSQFEAIDYLKNNPKKSAVMLAPRLHIPPQQILAGLQDIRFPDAEENMHLLYSSPPPLEQTARALQSLMTDKQLLNTQVRVNLLIDRYWQKELNP